MRMRFRTLFLLVALLVGGAASAASQDSTADYIAAIERPRDADGDSLARLTLPQLMLRLGVPGVSIAVIRDFEVHWAKAYGVADVETGAPVDVGTVFQAASISKPVAAMAVLKAVQDGVFSLDDDINDILTSWTLNGGEFTRDRPVTPRLLTSHTSGLGDGFGFPGYGPDAPLPTIVQIMNGEEPSNVGEVFMERPPLTAMKYSGGGVTMMQLAMVDALERPFPEILDEYVLGPIGMESSSFEQPISPARDDNAARAHGSSGDAMGPKWHVYPEMAAAGLWTTPTDLALFLIEVQKSAVGEANHVLSRTTVREMLTPVGVGGYAVGFAVGRIGEGWYFSHGGSNWGFRARIIAHTAKGYGLVVMTNGTRGGAVVNEISERVQRAYGWDTLDEPVRR